MYFLLLFLIHIINCKKFQIVPIKNVSYKVIFNYLFLNLFFYLHLVDRIIESCQEAFILRLYRENNKVHKILLQSYM